jgi:hypothetical protein
MKKTASKLTVLLRDFGYTFEAGMLIDRGIQNFIRSKIVGKFSSELTACDHLCSIIKDEEFTRRLMAAQSW